MATQSTVHFLEAGMNKSFDDSATNNNIISSEGNSIDDNRSQNDRESEGDNQRNQCNNCQCRSSIFNDKGHMSVNQIRRALMQRNTLLVASLSFSVGWANAHSVEIYGSYATMMTGNWINFGYAVGDRRGWDALFFLTVIASFVFGHATFRLVSSPKLFQSQPWIHKHASSVLAPVVLALCSFQDIWMHFFPSHKIRYVITLLSCAMGIVTCAAAVVNGLVCNIFTGHTTNVTNLLCTGFLDRKLDKSQIDSIVCSTALIIIFLCGILWGTLYRQWLAPFIKDNENEENDKFVVFVMPLGFVLAIVMFLHDFQISTGQIRDFLSQYMDWQKSMQIPFYMEGD